MNQSLDTVVSYTSRSKSRRPTRGDAAAALTWLLLACIAAGALLAGLHLRQWAWDQSKPWRFEADIRNAYAKGELVLREPDGYFKLYTRFRAQPKGGSSFNLDYPPLRLLIVSRWVAWTHRKFPKAQDWQPTYAFNAPLLEFNTACGIAGAAGMWLLVGFWIARRKNGGNSRGKLPFGSAPEASRSRRWNDSQILGAAFVGLLAGLLFWFDPALIWDAHVWPQWDIWPLAFFIFALLAASLDWWWIAGMLIAIAALLKGQTLLVAPVLVLCPLFAGKPRAACRIAAGFAFTLLAVAIPWLLRAPGGWDWKLSKFSLAWVISAVIAGVLIHPSLVILRRRRALRIAAAIVAAGLLAWPLFVRHSPADLLALLAVAALFAAVALVPPRLAPRLLFWLSAVTAIALGICALFGGNMDWWTVGFMRGTTQYMRLHIGSTLNLAAILERFGWSSPTDNAWKLAGRTLPLRSVLIGIYGLGLIVCAVGAAMNWRRRDVRALIGLCTPWVLMYAILPQMHDRYLVFAAGITAIAAGVSVGLTLVHLLITALACASVLASVNSANPPWLQRTLHSIYPDASWLTLMCAAIFLWTAIAPPMPEIWAGMMRICAGARKRNRRAVELETKSKVPAVIGVAGKKEM